MKLTNLNSLKYILVNWDAIMSQGQDMTLKYISKDYLKKLISILPKDIDIEIDETTEIEVL